MGNSTNPVCLTLEQAISAAAAVAFKADTLRRWAAEAEERGQAISAAGDTGYADRLDAIVEEIHRQLDAAKEG
jgi:hypothetical protein